MTHSKRYENSLSLVVMETIAITEWNNGISPLYDAACTLCVFTEVGERKYFNIMSLSLAEKANLCRDANVDVLICGAISTLALEILKQKEIQVITCICGPIDTIVKNYRESGAIDTCYVMPGCLKQHHYGMYYQPSYERKKQKNRLDNSDHS